MATIHPASDFNAEKSAEILRKAMKGIGTDEKAIVDILCAHNNLQRQEIRKTFKTMYGKDLDAEIKSEISGNFEKVSMALLLPKYEYLASQLRAAMKGGGTDEAVLIEILCTRKNDEIREVKECYKKLYDRNLEDDINSETSKHFCRLLISQVNAGRDETPDVDEDKAAEDAKTLYDAGEGQLGTDESEFNRVLCLRSFPQLRCIFVKYAHMTGKDIEDSIKSETSGDLEAGYLAIVKSVKNLPHYFAERLYKSMKGAGTDDACLIRIMVSRSEVDMKDVMREFGAHYGKSLGDFIRDDTSGDYERILLRIIGE